MKIAVFGTPQLSADIFESISAVSGIDIVSVVTVPDKRAGRGKKLSPSPVKQWAEKKSIPLFQPEKPDKKLANMLQEKGVEVMIVVSYGKIFSEEFLCSAPPAWNLHFSLLPKFRGASPVPAAILAGEKISGVTVFHISPGLDNGPILGQQETVIEGMRADFVFADMIHIGSQLLIALLLQKKAKQEFLEIPQNESKATICGKIKKQDACINPLQDSAEEALLKVNAFYPWPGTYVEFHGKRLKIHSAQFSDISLAPGEFCFQKNGTFLGFSEGCLSLLSLQKEGKREVSGEEFSRGQK